MGYVIVAVVVLLAAWYAGRRMWAALHGDASDCGCCSKCSSSRCDSAESKGDGDECGK